MSLRLKMVLGIGMVLIVVIGAFAVISARIQAAQFLELSRREADVILTVTERAIARAMTEGKKDQVGAILEEIGGLPNLVGLRITDVGGTILRSSRPVERGQALAPDAARDDSRVMDTVRADGDAIVEVARVIPNRPECHACHGSGRTTLGIIDARVAFPSVGSQVARQWAAMVLPAMVALVATGGLIGAYFTVVVGRRINTLCEAMTRVEASGLMANVPDGDSDELGRVGKSFNVMVARLADAQRRLEDRHAQEIRRAEHLAALGKVAAGVAHEINNPLAGMQNCVRTLLRGTRDERRRVQYLEMLQEGLGRVGGIVSRLLNFARERRPLLAKTDPAPIVKRSLAFLEHDFEARHITCSVTSDPALPPLVADPAQLEQVLVNLVMNAVEAMPGGGTLTIATGVRRGGDDRFVEIRVADTGVGIAPENIPKVFDPFFTTKDVGKGTGLGLSVSYGIVRAHDGFIEVESEVGKGSTFTVVLPVAPDGRL